MSNVYSADKVRRSVIAAALVGSLVFAGTGNVVSANSGGQSVVAQSPFLLSRH